MRGEENGNKSLYDLTNKKRIMDLALVKRIEDMNRHRFSNWNEEDDELPATKLIFFLGKIWVYAET